MRKLTLLSAAVLLGLSLIGQAWGASYKFKSNPHLRLVPSQTVEDYIYVPTNVKMTSVRIGVHIKSVLHSSLKITLLSPGGVVVLKNDQANTTAWYGSLGSERSYCLFRDGGAAYGATGQPYDFPLNPAQPLNQLNQKIAQGYWTLRVEDNRYVSNSIFQDGYFESWVVMFNEVVVEPEIPVWSATRTGAQLIGIMNGQSQVIPNEKNALVLCTVSGEPNVTPGLNGDAFPFIVQNTGYPTHTIGSTIPGYSTPGRFKITLNIATNLPPPSPVAAAYTGDISVFFGKSPSYNPPLQSPPSPPKTAGVAAQWPRGSGNFTNTLLGSNPTSNLHGGVRLSSCNAEDAVPWAVPFGDVGGYIDCSFDDRALNSITTADSPTGGVSGEYKPEQPLSGLNGNLLEGLYYLTVYDTFGENFTPFGHIRVLSVTVTYLAGGGETANPDLHQGIAGPLQGVPIPGAIPGYLGLGYLPDVIGTIPPYSIHAKDQDPMLLFWATQKMGPRSAVGWERVRAIQPSNYVPPAGVLYDGPYSYPAALDQNPMRAGSQVQSDIMALPPSNYSLHLFLNQPRYDDDNSDNDFYSGNIKVTNTTTGYYGDLIPTWNLFQAGAGGGYTAQLSFGANQGWGSAFSVFKFPTTKVTSIDYMLDQGFTAAPINGSLRVTVWKTSAGFFGSPVGPKVAQSPTVANTLYHRGNWRSFPLQPCDAAGNPITNQWSVDLAPGTYVVMMEVVAGTHVMYPYTYGQLPFLTDRTRDFHFSENFGPLAPFSVGGNRLQYVTLNTSFPPAQTFSSLSTPSNFGNVTFPMRMNFTNQNDFSIDYVNFSGTGGTESVAITNAPFAPRIYVSSHSLQGNAVKDFNARLEIYSGSQRIYLSDVFYGSPTFPGISAYQTVAVPMANWTPALPGEYRVRASFSRNPDDQNPVNDVVDYQLRITATRAILLTGGGVEVKDLNAAVEALKNKGMSVTVSSINSVVPQELTNSSVYFMGDIDAAGKNVLTQAVNAGSDIAMMYNTDEAEGSIMRTIDGIFDVNRGDVNYAKIDMSMKNARQVVANAPQPAIPDIQINSKEDVAAAIKALNASSIDPVTPTESQLRAQDYSSLLPAAISSPYGDLRFENEVVGSIGISYITPSVRKSPSLNTDATVVAGFTLEQNYPNPFNPSTTISYTLPEESFVTLRVTDMLGREVMTLVSRNQKAGGYTMTWKGDNQLGEIVSSGTYLYRLDATPVSGGAPFTSLKKMTFSK